jgi:hypothetical protein
VLGPAAEAVGPEGTFLDVFHPTDLEVLVSRRIWFAVTAVMAASLAVGVGMAAGASPKASSKPAIKPITLHCKVSMTTTPPADSNVVDQPAAQGSQYGPNHCATKGFGSGMISDSFTVPDSGDTVGTYTQFFHGGTITGAFDLTPSESSGLSQTGFTSESWTGTITVTGGTGLYKGIVGKKHSGTINCTSPDTVHLACTEKIKVTMKDTNTLTSTPA